MTATRLPLAVAAAAFTALTAYPPVQAAPQATEQPAFEVASVKPNKGDGPTESGTQPGGRLTMVNVPLRFLIRSAYQVQDDQIVEAPGWIAAEHFDVLAKAPGEIPPPTPARPGPLPLMMRSLLAERFKLAVHRETREFPAYALRLARRDGRLGAQLRPSTVDCAALAATRGAGTPPPVGNGRPQCGIRAAGGQMMAGGMPLSQLTTLLSSMVQRVVIDKTGLNGNFDFELKWTPDRVPSGAPSGIPAERANDPDAPSIFTALQEQLGLRLESTTNLVEVLVIDHVERPTPD
jgi:uncharacterized protein (TIGR03435 family)